MPIDYDKIKDKENKLLLFFERIGQISVTFSVLVFNKFNITNFSLWIIWLVISFTIMLLYELCWIRYFKSEKRLIDFYGKYLKIPVPLASLPIISFLLLGIYGKNIWLITSTIILGIGHIGIHLSHIEDIDK